MNVGNSKTATQIVTFVHHKEGTRKSQNNPQRAVVKRENEIVNTNDLECGQ